MVDDFERWRRAICSMLQKQPELQVIGEITDGLEATQEAQNLQPDLILLDIGLPTLNGIEAAQRIRTLSPKSKILFVSQETSADVVQGALSTGAEGYVVKMDARRELLMAVNAVLRGEEFVGTRFAGHDFTGASGGRAIKNARHNRVLVPFPQQGTEIAGHHAAGFYSDERCFLDDLTQFIGAALKAGNAAIVVATESHRHSLLLRLQAYGLDISAAIEQGRYVTLDAANTLAIFMVNELPDPPRFFEAFGNLITTTAEAAIGKHARVAVFGECVDLLWAQGNVDGAIQMEKLGNRLAKIYDVDILCGYSLGSVEGGMDSDTFQRICAEHSAVHHW